MQDHVEFGEEEIANHHGGIYPKCSIEKSDDVRAKIFAQSAMSRSRRTNTLMHSYIYKWWEMCIHAETRAACRLHSFSRSGNDAETVPHRT